MAVFLQLGHQRVEGDLVALRVLLNPHVRFPPILGMRSLAGSLNLSTVGSGLPGQGWALTPAR